MHISQIYAENLLPLREGYPLWIPEPDEELPMCYRQSGVRIGDVGVIGQDGGFQFIFNICSSADDPVNQCGVPPSFERIDMGATSYKSTYYSRDGAFVQSADFARNVIGVEAGADATIVPAGAGFGIEFSVGKDEGAILALPRGGSRRDARQRRAYEIQIQRHGQEWYTYVRDTLGWMIDNGDLYLVTGVDKAATWGALAFRDTQRSREVSFQFTATPVANAALRHQYQWRHITSQSARQGPDAGVQMYDDDGEPAENQCVFVRGYKIMLRRELWSRTRATGLKVFDFTGPRNFGKSISLKAASSSSASASSAAKGKARQAEPTDICVDSADGSSGTFNDEEDGSRSGGNSSSEEENRSAEGGVSWELVPAWSTPCHPCDALNKYILDNSDCNIAFTHDDLWTCMASHVDVVRDLKSQAISTRYDLETMGSGAVTLRYREDVEGMKLGQRDAEEDLTMSGLKMSSEIASWPSLDKNVKKYENIEDSAVPEPEGNPVYKQEGSPESYLFRQEEWSPNDMQWEPSAESWELRENPPSLWASPASQMISSETLEPDPEGTNVLSRIHSPCPHSFSPFVEAGMSRYGSPPAYPRFFSTESPSSRSLDSTASCGASFDGGKAYGYRILLATESRRRAARRASLNSTRAGPILTCPVIGSYSDTREQDDIFMLSPRLRKSLQYARLAPRAPQTQA
ncbi:uncharacterized protein SCHCODRAFT_02682424 [Schizophyllum commune H4-8]|nr:uncharacterized protein SCHCODRAFT_02682424 [Schizophyllum commune H4-8]KAI5899405.1 hypothetical protein SCHCODRAFT_02682424 [Schizophyllum commune H4-8]